MILRVRIFYCKNPKNEVDFFVSRTRESEFIKFKVPEYGSRFPSTGPGSWVRVQVPKYRSRFLSTVPPNRFLFRSRFPSTGPGSLVWVQVPKYGSRFPSTGPLLGFYLGPGSQVRVQAPKYGFWKNNWNHLMFANLFKNVTVHNDLPTLLWPRKITVNKL